MCKFVKIKAFWNINVSIGMGDGLDCNNAIDLIAMKGLLFWNKIIFYSNHSDVKNIRWERNQWIEKWPKISLDPLDWEEKFFFFWINFIPCLNNDYIWWNQQEECHFWFFWCLFQPIIWFFSIQSLFHLFSLYNRHFWININQMTNKKKLIHHTGSILDIIEKISIKIILPHHCPTPFFVLFLSNSSISRIYWIFMIWEDYLVISLWKRRIKWTFGNKKWNENKWKEKYYLYLPLSKFQNMRK